MEAHQHVGHDDATPLRRLRWVLLLTATFMVVEALGGWLAGSLALLADAGHMLTDVAALGLSLLTAFVGLNLFQAAFTGLPTAIAAGKSWPLPSTRWLSSSSPAGLCSRRLTAFGSLGRSPVDCFS